MSRSLFMLALVVWLIAPPVAAERYELTPFVGYRFSQDFDAILNQVPRAVQIDNSASYGLIFDIGFGETAQLELLVSRQETAMLGRPASSGAEMTLFDVDVDHYHIGGLYQFVEEADWVRPFFSFTLGVTRLDPESPLSTETKFSVGLAAGLKFLIGERVGIRTQVRWAPTWINSNSSIFCGPDNSCFVVVDADRVDQVEASVGLMFRF